MKKYRPDLTSYLPIIEALTDKLNEDALFKMSRTERKRYIKLDF